MLTVGLDIDVQCEENNWTWTSQRVVSASILGDFPPSAGRREVGPHSLREVIKDIWNLRCQDPWVVGIVNSIARHIRRAHIIATRSPVAG